MKPDVRPEDLTPEPVTVADLWSAVEWLSTYEGQDDDPNPQALANVMALLEREANRRQRRADVRAALKAKYGRSNERAVSAVIRRMEETP